MNPTDWLNEVWRSDLPSNSKLLAAYLRWYLHSNSQTCWPSKATIQRDTGLAKRTIQKHLVTLEQEGWITIIRSNGGHSNKYKIAPVLNDRIGRRRGCAENDAHIHHEEDDPATGLRIGQTG